MSFLCVYDEGERERFCDWRLTTTTAKRLGKTNQHQPPKTPPPPPPKKGDYASCVLTLLPRACLYRASGINANLQYCGAGFRELPNGCGFGGQLLGTTGHFG